MFVQLYRHMKWYKSTTKKSGISVNIMAYK